MTSYEKKIEIRWSDLDPNFHVLHSRYYDFGAFCRMAFFVEHGLSTLQMKEHNIGPILFREECIFKREIAFGDDIQINLFITKHSVDYGRWSMMHEIRRNNDILAAVIHIDGAWMDTVKRKLTLPPEALHPLFDNAPHAPGFGVYKK